MPSAGKKTILRGLMFQLIAILGVLASAGLGLREARALNLPIDLHPGVTRSKLFRAEYASNYEVSLEVDRTLPFEATRCLLGDLGPGEVMRAPTGCERPPPLSLTWKIFGGDRTIAQGGNTAGQFGSYGSTIARLIGEAELKPHEDYVIEVTSHQDASALAGANPRVVVEVHPSAWKDEFAIRGLLTVPFLLLAVFGTGTLVVGTAQWTAGALRMWRTSNRVPGGQVRTVAGKTEIMDPRDKPEDDGL